MFDDKMICPGSLRNQPGPTPPGFLIDLRLPYYRGLGLSMVEDIALSIDGVPIERAHLTLCLHGNRYPLDALDTAYHDRWNFGEVATLAVAHPGGLAPGTHRVMVAERLRISYLPMVPTTRFTLAMDLAPA